MLLLQIVNYDRVLDRGVAALPRIDAGQTAFIRNYEIRDGEMHFMTELSLRNGAETYRNDIVILPVRRAELAEAGFGDVEYYGNYAGDPLTADSFHLIAKAVAV